MSNFDPDVILASCAYVGFVSTIHNTSFGYVCASERAIASMDISVGIDR